eukprot:5071268-Amphidinium_carterae.1
MQSAVNGVVTAACQEQSNAAIVREMALKCFSECEESSGNHRVCGAHSHWSALDGRVRCHQCAPSGHHGPLIRIR